MMSAHELLVKTYFEGEIMEIGRVVEYSGELNWKFRPLDPEEFAIWTEKARDDARVAANLKLAGGNFDLPAQPPRRDIDPGYTPEILAGLAQPEPRRDRYGEID